VGHGKLRTTGQTGKSRGGTRPQAGRQDGGR
jgi:hypothetical protein